MVAVSWGSIEQFSRPVIISWPTVTVMSHAGFTAPSGRRAVRRPAVAVVVLTLAGALAACGGDPAAQDASPTADRVTASATPDTSTSAAPAPGDEAAPSLAAVEPSVPVESMDPPGSVEPLEPVEPAADGQVPQDWVPVEVEGTGISFSLPANVQTFQQDVPAMAGLSDVTVDLWVAGDDTASMTAIYQPIPPEVPAEGLSAVLEGAVGGLIGSTGLDTSIQREDVTVDGGTGVRLTGSAAESGIHLDGRFLLVDGAVVGLVAAGADEATAAALQSQAFASLVLP